MNKVTEAWEEYAKTVPQEKAVTKHFLDMYLHPPTSERSYDSRDWIRVRQVDGLFYVQFYNEVLMGS